MQVDIMFSQNSVAPDTLFGIVCSCCIEVMGRTENITRFMNAAPTANAITNSEYGLLGRFPLTLATRILEALKDKPITTNALPGRLPKHWDGSQRAAYGQLWVLEFGGSYVVAEQLSARRVVNVTDESSATPPT